MIVLKTPEEIRLMREAGRIVARTLEALVAMVRPGVRTLELDAEAERLIRQAGALPSFKGYRGYPASVCVSVNEEVVHGIPGPRRLREGDLVSLDVGACLRGYHGDAAVTVPVGEDLSPRASRLLAAGRGALAAAIEKAQPGNRLGDVSHAIQSHAESLGFSVVRDYAGHGIGQAMHEDPQVPCFGRPGTGPLLRTGMVLAIEPMLNAGTEEVEVLDDGWTVVTRDREPSVHFEHTVAVTDEGPVVLTLP